MTVDLAEILLPKVNGNSRSSYLFVICTPSLISYHEGEGLAGLPLWGFLLQAPMTHSDQAADCGAHHLVRVPIGILCTPALLGQRVGRRRAPFPSWGCRTRTGTQLSARRP